MFLEELRESWAVFFSVIPFVICLCRCMCPTCCSISIECNFYVLSVSALASEHLWWKLLQYSEDAATDRLFSIIVLHPFVLQYTSHFTGVFQPWLNMVGSLTSLRNSWVQPVCWTALCRFASNMLWGQNGWFVCNSVTCTWVPWKSKPTSPSSWIRPYQTGFIIPFQNLR